MALKVKIAERRTDVVGKGTIDGDVPFYYKDQGHRWMVRIGNEWKFKQDVAEASQPSLPAARGKMYWAIAAFRDDARNTPDTDSGACH